MYPGTFAAITPDKPAVIMGGSARSSPIRELNERSARLAQLLFARGLRPGDKIAFLAENHPRYYEVTWAAMPRGALPDDGEPLPRPGRGRLPSERLGRDRVHHHGPDGADGATHAGPDSGLSHPPHDGRGGGRFRILRGGVGRLVLGVPDQSTPGPGDALLVGDYRPS